MAIRKQLYIFVPIMYICFFSVTKIIKSAADRFTSYMSLDQKSHATSSEAAIVASFSKKIVL